MEYTIDQALTKGIEFHKIKDFRKANHFYKKVLKLEPLHSYANHNSGIVCLDTGKVKDSIEFFRIALKSNPNYIQFWISYINALIKLKKINEAEKVYKRAQELGAKGKVFENLGINLLNIKSNIINLNKVQKKGDPSENELKKIYDLFKKENYQSSLDAAYEMIEEYPKSLLLFNLNGVLHHKLKNYKDSLKNYELAIKLQPKNPEIYINIGNVHRDLRNFDEALSCFKYALKLKPNFSEAFNCMALTYKDKNNINLALDNFKKAISFQPNNCMFYNNLGDLLRSIGEFDKALKNYQQSFSIDPSFEQSVFLSEFLLKEKKDPKNALILLEKALLRNPMDTRSNAYKYVALRGLGKFNDAENLVNFSRLVFNDNIKNYTNKNIFDFNQKLLSALELHPRRVEEFDKVGFAIRGGTVIRNLFINPDPIIKKFQDLLIRAIDRRINNLPHDANHPFLIKKPKNYTINCWANLLQGGDYQSNHIHNLGWMSGVYYVDLPKLENTNKLNQGFIEFNRAGYGLPHFGKDQGVKLIKPEIGMIIFFPSYVWHGTIPFLGKENRVSISFDVSFN